MAEVALDISRQRNGGIAYQWKEDGRGSYGQSVSRTHAELIDMNGDGLPELVWTDNGQLWEYPCALH